MFSILDRFLSHTGPRYHKSWLSDITIRLSGTGFGRGFSSQTLKTPRPHLYQRLVGSNLDIKYTNIYFDKITWIQHICKNLFQWRTRVPKTSSARWHCQLESFCGSGKFLRVSKEWSKKCSPNINWRVNKCGKFPDCLKSFRTVWKLSKRSWKFPDRLENVQTVWKVFRQFGKFPDGPESCMLRFTHFWRIFVAKASYALLAHICRKNDLGTLSGKFLQMKFCEPESFDFLCLYEGPLFSNFPCQFVSKLVILSNFLSISVSGCSAWKVEESGPRLFFSFLTLGWRQNTTFWYYNQAWGKNARPNGFWPWGGGWNPFLDGLWQLFSVNISHYKGN